MDVYCACMGAILFSCCLSVCLSVHTRHAHLTDPNHGQTPAGPLPAVQPCRGEGRASGGERSSVGHICLVVFDYVGWCVYVCWCVCVRMCEGAVELARNQQGAW